MTRPTHFATCAGHDVTRACRQRWDAVARGRFFWQDYVGWLWLDSIDPHQPWDFCPWCGGALPALVEEDLLDRLRQADGTPDAAYGNEEGE